jgi:hypothetical protein
MKKLMLAKENLLPLEQTQTVLIVMVVEEK